MRKFTLLLAVLFLVSCKANHTPEITTSFDTEFEILHGRVKQLSETYKANEYSRPTTHVTNFDIRGNPTQTKTTGDCDCLTRYKYRYDNNGKKTEVTAKNNERLFPFLYTYDASGRIVQLTVDTKELKDDPASNMQKQDKDFYKYNAAGDRVQDDYYYDTKHQILRKYRYNAQHILMEEDIFSSFGTNKEPDSLNKRQKPDIKIIYQYKAFDAKGNWVKKIAIKEDNDLTQKPEIEKDTVTRKITYY